MTKMLDRNSVVVVVDTDKKAQSLIKSFFSLKNIKVMCFDSPKEALFNLDPTSFKEKIGLLITDLYLPDIITGKELSDILKNHYKDMQALIIVNRPAILDLNSVSKSTGYFFMRPEEMTKKISEFAVA